MRLQPPEDGLRTRSRRLGRKRQIRFRPARRGRRRDRIGGIVGDQRHRTVERRNLSAFRAGAPGRLAGRGSRPAGGDHRAAGSRITPERTRTAATRRSVATVAIGRHLPLLAVLSSHALPDGTAVAAGTLRLTCDIQERSAWRISFPTGFSGVPRHRLIRSRAQSKKTGASRRSGTPFVTCRAISTTKQPAILPVTITIAGPRILR